MEQFSWFDIVSVSLILILAIKGIINGFFKEIFGLIGIVGGVIAAFKFDLAAGKWIDVNLYAIEHKGALSLIGFIAVLLSIWILSIFLGRIFEKLFSLSCLGFVDKLAGFIVGGAKVFLIFAIIFVLSIQIDFMKQNLDKHLHDSFMYPIFTQTGELMLGNALAKIKSSFETNKANGTEADRNNVSTPVLSEKNTSEVTQ